MSEPVATASASAMEIEEEVYVPRGNIKSVNRIVGTWTFSCSTDTCAICRNGITSPSCNYQRFDAGTIGRKDSCKIAFQSCGHPFHYDCIIGWYKQRVNNCPLCNKEVTIDKIEPVHGHETEV